MYNNQNLPNSFRDLQKKAQNFGKYQRDLLKLAKVF